jgi:RNA polymerase sigma-70 factor (ECF subfamily)
LSPAEEQATSVNDDAVGSRRRELLRELLEDLPEEQAEALALRVVMGWSLEEVAQASGAPVNTVRSRVRLAKEALRQRIEALPGLAELKVNP